MHMLLPWTCWVLHRLWQAINSVSSAQPGQANRRGPQHRTCLYITGTIECASSMPVYELLCLARPLLQRNELQQLIQKVGGLVYEKGGVITNVVSYGTQPLAYKIKGVQGKYEQAHIWQLDFALSPEALREVNMQMRINEDVLRYAVVKRSLPKLPNPRTLYHRLSEHKAELRPPRPPGQAEHLINVDN